MFPSLFPTPELETRSRRGEYERSEPVRGRERPRVLLVEIPPEEGFHEVSGILFYRVLSDTRSLMLIADEMDAYRASHLIGPRRPFVIVLPVGSSRDPFVEELHSLSMRGIGVQVEGTVSFVDLIASARARGSWRPQQPDPSAPP